MKEEERKKSAKTGAGINLDTTMNLNDTDEKTSELEAKRKTSAKTRAGES